MSTGSGLLSTPEVGTDQFYPTAVHCSLASSTWRSPLDNSCLLCWCTRQEAIPRRPWSPGSSSGHRWSRTDDAPLDHVARLCWIERQHAWECLVERRGAVALRLASTRTSGECSWGLSSSTNQNETFWNIYKIAWTYLIPRYDKKSKIKNSLTKCQRTKNMNIFLRRKISPVRIQPMFCALTFSL